MSTSAGEDRKALVVEDDEDMRSLIEFTLSTQGFDVTSVESGLAAVEAVRTGNPDLVTLDLGLPGIDGIEVIRGLRGWTATPILVLSARDRETDKIDALDAGADDYVTKPFGMGELLARLRAALRRAAPPGEEPVVVTPDFTVDLVAKRITGRDGDEVKLTPIEWGLVETLVRNAGKLVSGRQLLQEVWGPQYGEETNYLRVHMAHIRRKLEREPSRPRYFRNEPGLGYRFVLPEDGS
jgi:two-component system KDP operon response regulator KdpE